jgi:3-methyladenine DNA glycosylase/8-oxoguanine DNA glycosylase
VVAETLPGLRVLKQEPWECLVSFIFSANNNVKRITKGLKGLRSNYGQYLCSLTVSPVTSPVSSALPCGGEEEAMEIYLEDERERETLNESSSSNVVHRLYAFPTPTDLVDKSSEQLLRELGMGYRAR